jgi:hypothetical protein
MPTIDPLSVAPRGDHGLSTSQFAVLAKLSREFAPTAQRGPKGCGNPRWQSQKLAEARRQVALFAIRVGPVNGEIPSIIPLTEYLGKWT